VSDSLMFERGDPTPSDAHMGQVYGLALPLLKRGMPIAPVQLENVPLRGYLKGFRGLLLTYQGMKPLAPQVHRALADWVRAGGALVVVDDDSDPFNRVAEWWNGAGRNAATPRLDLFEQLGLREYPAGPESKPVSVGKGSVLWLRENPVALTAGGKVEADFVSAVERAVRATGAKWKEANHLLLRRGPYIVAAGLDESVGGDSLVLVGRFINLFDPDLKVQNQIRLEPGSRFFLVDLSRVPSGGPRILASACKTLKLDSGVANPAWAVEGVEGTQAVVLISLAKGAPRSVTLDGAPIDPRQVTFSDRLLRVRFENRSTPRQLRMSF
jgi:hypothetical protein